jgi:phage I-like protein
MNVAMLDAFAVDGAPNLVKVAPRGPVMTRDGRSYTFVPETLVARFTADGIDLPIDLDHSIARSSQSGERADAVGWVKKLQACADGLYAHVEWLQSGLAVLASRTHRFISPTFHHDASGTATWLHSIALVAAPALSMPAIASANVSAGMTSAPDPEALAAAARNYLEARAALGIRMTFADAVMAVTGGMLD